MVGVAGQAAERMCVVLCARRARCAVGRIGGGGGRPGTRMRNAGHAKSTQSPARPTGDE